jgi:hypothetical protein
VADFQELSSGWRSSTASGPDNCVEAATISGSVLVRDSANRQGPVLRFSPTVWSAFVRHARADNPEPRRA